MIYIFIALIVVVAIYFVLYQRLRIKRIKRNGIRVVGTIIQNMEPQGSRFQLGGNINSPTVSYFTTEGQEIIGRPVVGFVTQHEVVVPSQVHIIYNSKNPEQFYLDFE